MNFGVCEIKIIDKNIKYSFSEDFINELNKVNYEKKLKKSNMPTSSIWKKDSLQTQWIKKS